VASPSSGLAGEEPAQGSRLQRFTAVRILAPPRASAGLAPDTSQLGHLAKASRSSRWRPTTNALREVASISGDSSGVARTTILQNLAALRRQASARPARRNAALGRGVLAVFKIADQRGRPRCSRGPGAREGPPASPKRSASPRPRRLLSERRERAPDRPIRRGADWRRRP